MMKYLISSSSRLGNRQENQDGFAVVESPEALLLVVADGMGGHGGGKLAADVAIRRLEDLFKRSKKPIPHPHGYLRHIINDAHYAVIDAGYQQVPPLVPRTTCVVALIQQQQLWIAHIGDSRCYLVHDGAVAMRTRDHSRIEELQQAGKITPAQAEHHPDRHVITRCVGGELARAEASLGGPYPLSPGDVIALCSDGLWGAVSERDLVLALRQSDLDRATRKLTNQAEAHAYPNADNCTLVALRWLGTAVAPPPEPNDPPPPPPAAADTVDQAIATLQQIFAEYQSEMK